MWYTEKNIEWRIVMPVSYDRLWKLLIDKKMNRTDLKEAAGISFNVLAKLGRDEFVSMESIYKICLALDCDIGDVICIENRGIQK
jgi:DNA (cytosine-5)-methyltransferase 1